MITWKPPEVGDIVWCHFPEIPSRDQPGSKARPALVVAVEKHDGMVSLVRVVPGTSKRLDQLHGGEATITRQGDLSAFTRAGLTLDTKFQFGSMLALRWKEPWFKTPSHRPHGNTPKLGTLHASLFRKFFAAYQAVHTDET